jgi:saccharopine dehydrogenase-like NADP-dependent oxidoreductase
MKKGSLLVVGWLVVSIGVSFGQKTFNNCSAVFLNNKMVVSEYSSSGKSQLAANTTGMLTVCTAEITSTETKAVDKISFKVAIRNQRTNTLTLFSKQDFTQVNIQNVLKKCAKGDFILLMTTDEQYALPHNEILVL